MIEYVIDRATARAVTPPMMMSSAMVLSSITIQLKKIKMKLKHRFFKMTRHERNTLVHTNR